MTASTRRVLWAAVALSLVASIAVIGYEGDSIILFQSERDGNMEIYSIRAECSWLVRLTDDTGADIFAEVSPDGAWVVFSSDRSGTYNLFLMRLDGTELSQLTDSSLHDFYPSWSPDGRRIVFQRSGAGDAELIVIEVESGSERVITDNNVEDMMPDWSPDGEWIVFVRGNIGSQHIAATRPDGSGCIELTGVHFLQGAPRWSPDGTRVAFNRDPGNRNADIYVVDSDGANERRLTRNAAVDEFPVWSPQGDAIVFWSLRFGDADLFILNLAQEGGSPSLLDRASGWDGPTDWISAPDL